MRLDSQRKCLHNQLKSQSFVPRSIGRKDELQPNGRHSRLVLDPQSTFSVEAHKTYQWVSHFSALCRSRYSSTYLNASLSRSVRGPKAARSPFLNQVSTFLVPQMGPYSTWDFVQGGTALYSVFPLLHFPPQYNCSLKT